MDHLTRLAIQLRRVLRRVHHDDAGFSTAELLGNAALGVVALVVIWGLLRALGVDLIEMIRGELLTGAGS